MTDVTFISKDRLARLQEVFSKEVADAAMSHKHLWVALFTHTVSPALLDRQPDPVIETDPDDAPLFDDETLRGAYVGCFICETPWEPHLTHKRCRGESVW